MQTAPGKFCSGSIFFMIVLWPLACTSSDRAPTPVEWTENHVEAPSPPTIKAFAKLIDRDLAASQPHLRPHQGQIVLGQNQLQLVAGSVPPLSGGSVFYPVLSAIYKATDKSWQQQTWQPSLDINISTMNGESLALIGQDIEHHNNQPHLISFFRSSKPELGAVRLDMQWLGESPLVKISIVQSGGTAPLRWILRLGSGYGAEHWIPFDQKRFLGVTVSLFPDVFTVLSPMPLSIRTEKQQTYLSAVTVPGRDNAFVLLPGREAVLQQAALVAQLKQCRGDCLRVPARSETWQIQLPWRQPMPRLDKRLFQSLFVHDAQGAFISTLPIFEGEPLKWNLPADAKWEVLYPDSQGILQKVQFDQDQRTAQLPPLALGSVQVQLKPGRPGFIDIRDAVRTGSVGWARQLASRPSDILTAHVFLQKTWPFTAQLPAGDYQLQIRDGMQRLCAQRFTILPGRHQVISCISESPSPELSLRANLSLDTVPSDEMLQAAHFQAIGRLLRTGKEISSAQEIPMLIAEDHSLGLSLRAFPADESLRRSWLAVKPRDHTALLPAFAKFAQDQNPPLQLVLECPQIGFQFEDYRWMALTLEPDMIEVFGCQQYEMMDAFLQVAHKLQQKSSHPIKLATSAPFRGRGLETDFIPALYIPQPQNLLNALRNGEYSLGLRSEILVTDPLPTSGTSEPQTLGVVIRSYDMKDQGALIRIHDQYGFLTELALPPGRNTEQKLQIPVRLRPSSRFLRVELVRQTLGPGGKEDGMTQPFLLATSNFLGLNGPP
ncbi:hypothetical protein [Oligoflexus tunisiensis]|uniref:hypothetical protein n=1 Tax=Oligoflexus tunisiensis TaxID=708132 RepID=UPI001C4041A9|nr:hypothetical protein [Oligoflexus tunisiensis]